MWSNKFYFFAIEKRSQDTSSLRLFEPKFWKLDDLNVDFTLVSFLFQRARHRKTLCLKWKIHFSRPEAFRRHNFRIENFTSILMKTLAVFQELVFITYEYIII